VSCVRRPFIYTQGILSCDITGRCNLCWLPWPMSYLYEWRGVKSHCIGWCEWSMLIAFDRENWVRMCCWMYFILLDVVGIFFLGIWIFPLLSEGMDIFWLNSVIIVVVDGLASCFALVWLRHWLLYSFLFWFTVPY